MRESSAVIERVEKLQGIAVSGAIAEAGKYDVPVRESRRASSKFRFDNATSAFACGNSNGALDGLRLRLLSSRVELDEAEVEGPFGT